MKTHDGQLTLETKGVWIPICIWDNKGLTLQEKAILVKIESFKECFASNEYLAEFADVSVSRIKQILKSLEEKGFIYRSTDRKGKVIVKRVISVDKAKFYGIDLDGSELNHGSDLGQETIPTKDRKLSQVRTGNCPDNSKANNKDNNKDIVGKPDTASKVIEYLNQRTGSKFRPVKSNLSLINARFNEGHSLDDVIAVIDRKCAEWSNDSKMRQYLRPSTLFNAEKFNTYVGQIGSPIPCSMGAGEHASRHIGFDKKDYTNGLVEQEDGTYVF